MIMGSVCNEFQVSIVFSFGQVDDKDRYTDQKKKDLKEKGKRERL